MKKFLKNTALIVLAVLFVMWNIIVLVSVKQLKDAGLYYWSGYGFMAAAFILVGASLFALRLKKEINFSVVVPAYIAVGVYFVLCLIMSSVLMGLHHYTMEWSSILGKYVDKIPPQSYNVAGAIVPNVLLLLLFVIMFVVAYRGVIHIGENNKIVEEKVKTLKITVVEIGQIAAIAEDAELKAALLALREDVEYSDPMGVAGTAAIEEEFRKNVAEIRVFIEENYEASLTAGKITAAKNKLRERNELLKSLK